MRLGPISIVCGALLLVLPPLAGCRDGPSAETENGTAANSARTSSERRGVGTVSADDAVRRLLDRISSSAWSIENPYPHLVEAMRVGNGEALKRLADSGHMRAQELVAHAYTYGTFGYPRDLPAAWRYYQHAIAAGSATAPYRASYLFDGDGDRLRFDSAQMARLLQIGAQRGEPHSMVKLGQFYYHGCGGLQADHNRALQLYRRASAMGAHGAHYQLGLLYLYGRAGLAQSDAEAVRLFRQDTSGDFNLGLSIYEREMGVRRTGSGYSPGIAPPLACVE